MLSLSLNAEAHKKKTKAEIETIRADEIFMPTVEMPILCSKWE